MAGPGDVLGLSGVMSGKPYELTAESIDPIQPNFMPQDALQRFLNENGQGAWRLAEILNKVYHATLRHVRHLGLCGSAVAKFAMFLFDQFDDGDERKLADRKWLTLSHEELSEMIGASRETVT